MRSKKPIANRQSPSWLLAILLCLPCAAQIVVQPAQVGPAKTNLGPYTEYHVYLQPGNILADGASFYHCCPSNSVRLSFNSVTGQTYVVELRDTTSPVRLEYLLTGQLIGISSENLSTNVSNTNTYRLLTNLPTSWLQVSPRLVGNGSNIVYEFNTIHTQAFIRVRQL